MQNSICRLILYVSVAAVFGGVTVALVNVVLDTPEIVDWCIAASVGYLSAEATEYMLSRIKAGE